MEKADIGLIGLAVMGQNLVLNMADHGYRVAVFNRTTSKVDEFIEGPASGTSIPSRRGGETQIAFSTTVCSLPARLTDEVRRTASFQPGTQTMISVERRSVA